MSQGNWIYSDNTLYCGNRQPQLPTWLSQSPSQGQGFNPGYSTLPAKVTYPTYSQSGCGLAGVCSDYQPQIQGPGYQTLPAPIQFAAEPDNKNPSEETGSGDELKVGE